MGNAFSPKLVVVVVAQQGGQIGGAGTEPPNFDLVVAVVARSWPSPITCLPAIVYDCVMYIGWQMFSH